MFVHIVGILRLRFISRSTPSRHRRQCNLPPFGMAVVIHLLRDKLAARSVAPLWTHVLHIVLWCLRLHGQIPSRRQVFFHRLVALRSRTRGGPGAPPPRSPSGHPSRWHPGTRRMAGCARRHCISSSCPPTVLSASGAGEYAVVCAAWRTSCCQAASSAPATLSTSAASTHLCHLCANTFSRRASSRRTSSRKSSPSRLVGKRPSCSACHRCASAMRFAEVGGAPGASRPASAPEPPRRWGVGRWGPRWNRGAEDHSSMSGPYLGRTWRSSLDSLRISHPSCCWGVLNLPLPLCVNVFAR